MAVNFSFPFTIDPKTHQIQEADEEKRIQDAIRCILLTHSKQRWMCPEFGSRVQDYVFELTDMTTMEMLRREMMHSLMTWGHGINNLDIRLHQAQDQLMIEVMYENEHGQEASVLMNLEMR